MMESSNLNLDHLHHQEELHGSSSSSSLAAPSFHFVGTNHEYWNQDLLLNINSGDFIPDTNGVLLSSSKDFMRLSHEMPVVQHPGFQPLGSNEELYMNNHSSHQVHLSKIKEELSDFFPKLSGINLRDHSNLQDYHLMPSHVKNELDQINGLQPPVGHDLGFDPMSLGCFGRRSFSMVLPTANISNSNQPPLQYSSCLGMDFQALDLLASARFGRALCQPSLDNIPLLREDLAYGLGQLQEQAQGPSASQHKISSSVSGVTEARRANNSLEYKASDQAAAKKPRFESRSSYTPFKVRKEKLGDRIAALQQLVAPFGKTDTASVLMEAIGYIKFLQDQVETLSVPYMRSSNDKKLRTSQGASSEDKDEPKPDLRSRGLCLVPLSCMSYVANEIGGVWSPPNYRGGT